MYNSSGWGIDLERTGVMGRLEGGSRRPGYGGCVQSRCTRGGSQRCSSARAGLETGMHPGVARSPQLYYAKTCGDGRTVQTSVEVASRLAATSQQTHSGGRAGARIDGEAGELQLLGRGPRGGWGRHLAEGPVAEHLEEGVVVNIFADVVEVVVLAAGTDALLRVGRARELRQRRRWVSGAEEDGFVLVHAGVGE